MRCVSKSLSYADDFLNLAETLVAAVWADRVRWLEDPDERLDAIVRAALLGLGY